MNRLAICTVMASLVAMSAGVAYGGNVLTDGGFEDSCSWNAYHANIGVDASNAGAWWVGGDGSGWIRQNASSYPYAGQYCAGDGDGYGQSAGLVQFAPVDAGDDHVSVEFNYLLWMGEGDTTMTYAVYGWNEGDTISLSTAGPGAGTAILSPQTLTSPQYAGDGTPYDDYSLETVAAPFVAGQFDYVGIWMRYNLDGGSFYVDDVSMRFAPEPATLGLLAAGGLMIFVRRSRKRF